ncbi:hypothetical protein ID0992_04830 [Helicobacter pylori]
MMTENAILTKTQRANDLKKLIKKGMILSQSYNSQTAMKISNKLKIVSAKTTENNTLETSKGDWPWRSKQGFCMANKMR